MNLGEGGFTLIELIVVIGIIAATAGVLGLALRGDNPSVALQSAQGTTASVLAAARSQAALSNSRAALLVYASQDDSGRYFHAFSVAKETDTGWVRTSDFVALPNGIYVVPSGNSVGNGGSTAISAISITIDGVGYLTVIYNALGLPETSAGKIVLAPATVLPADNGVPQFTNSGNVRGLILSAYGAVTFVNDSDGFQ